MTSKRMFFVMIGIIALLSITAVGIIVGGTILLRKQSTKLVALKLERRFLDEQQTALIQANKDIEQYSELEQISRAVVPQDKDQAKAVREIVQIADSVGINIKSISFPSSTLGASAAKTQQQNTSSDGNNGTGSSSSKSQSSAISQAKPVDGIPGVYSLEMNIVPETDTTPVSYYQFLDFLEKLENNRRTAQVTKVKITPESSDQNNPLITFTLTINIFIKP